MHATEAITDPKHSAARRVADILRHGDKGQQRTIIIDDEENVTAALANNVQIDSVYWTADDDISPELVAAIPESAARYTITPEVSKALFKAEKRSRLFAIARAPKTPLLKNIDTAGGDVIVLDGVRIAGNIGAIIRTAAAFDVAALILVDTDIASVFDRRVIRASRGTVFSIPVIIAQAEELASFSDRTGMPLVSLSAHDGSPLSDISQVNEPVAIVLGSEKRGASEFLESKVARRYRIRMSERVESLNVSVAAALALYERTRSRE